MSHKRNTPRPFVKERVEIPHVTKDKDGNIILLCPFCSPPHALKPDSISQCGSVLQVRAVQRVYNAKYKKDMVCVKCGKGGGEMVQWQSAFIHVENCADGVMTMTEPPKFSRMAKLVHKLPKFVKDRVEMFTGSAMTVDEVLPDGTRTGIVLGHFFHKGK